MALALGADSHFSRLAEDKYFQLDCMAFYAKKRYDLLRYSCPEGIKRVRAFTANG